MAEDKLSILFLGIRHALLTALDALELYLEIKPTTAQIRRACKQK